MKYSVEKMHEVKSGRRSGKSVDAIVDIIGKIFVTENETILLVVRSMDRADHLCNTFRDVCINHFHEYPIIKSKYEWKIKGYSSRIVIKTKDQDIRGFNLDPTYDLD